MTLSLEELEELETASSIPWKLIRRDGFEVPEIGADEVFGLGWDWDGSTPPQPMRGVFSLGADAVLIEAISSLIAMAKRSIELEKENEKLREALKPIAKLGSFPGPDELEDEDDSSDVLISLSEIMRARAALNGGE